MAGETYCPQCGGVLNSAVHVCLRQVVPNVAYERHPVGTGAELKRLRAIEARLRRHDLRLIMSDLWSGKVDEDRLRIIDAYRAVVLREEVK
jgi:hypothetical protein